MKTIDQASLDNWKEQILGKQLGWHKRHLAEETNVTTAYSAGFDEGWEQAIKMLKLHAGLKLTYGGHKVA